MIAIAMCSCPYFSSPLLLAILLMIGGVELNPGPAFNILAIIVMMIASPGVACCGQQPTVATMTGMHRRGPVSTSATSADAAFTDDMEFGSDGLDPWERPDPGSPQNSQGKEATMNRNDPQASQNQCEDGNLLLGDMFQEMMGQVWATHSPPNVTSFCHRQAPAAKSEAPRMFNTPYADLGLPFNQFLKKEETDISSLMSNSFFELFGTFGQPFEDEEFPGLALGARQGGLATAEQQHRWLLMGRALQEKANESVLMPSSALSDFLSWSCDLVEQHMLIDGFAGYHNPQQDMPEDSQTRLDYDGMIDDIDEGAACDNDDIVDEESSPNVQDLATVAVLDFCAHADEEAPCMEQEHAYARLAMPFDKLQKRHGPDIGYLMINSFAAFFDISPIDVPVERLGFYANQARQRPNTLVTSEHQHRWLLIGRALQAWRTTAKRPSKLRDNTALWGMLARLCDPLEETLEHLFAGGAGTRLPSTDNENFRPPQQHRYGLQQSADSEMIAGSEGDSPEGAEHDVGDNGRHSTANNARASSQSGECDEANDDDENQEAEDDNEAFGPEDIGDVFDCLNMDDEEDILSQAESEDLDARHGPNVEVPDSSFSPERSAGLLIVIVEFAAHFSEAEQGASVAPKAPFQAPNTKKAYHPKQRRFLEWAEGKYKENTVTSERAFAYLSLFTRQGAKWHKVEAHLKALRDLQQDQKVAGFGQQQSIRDYADIRLMMANLLAGMARMKRESRADRGAFSINDGYTQKEKIMMADQLMQRNGKAPTMHL
ncbi:TPA: hypothetical protein ACH3X2_002608 [Trebouxia sp. C0005]